MTTGQPVESKRFKLKKFLFGLLVPLVGWIGFLAIGIGYALLCCKDSDLGGIIAYSAIFLLGGGAVSLIVLIQAIMRLIKLKQSDMLEGFILAVILVIIGPRLVFFISDFLFY